MFLNQKNAKDIKSFLGLSGYYRRFISNFAKLSKQLTNLLQKKSSNLTKNVGTHLTPLKMSQ